MKRKNLMKKADNLVFILLGCASGCWFFSLLFFASYTGINRKPERQIEIQEYYDSPVELPKSEFDSINDSYKLNTGWQENKDLLTNKL